MKLLLDENISRYPSFRPTTLVQQAVLAGLEKADDRKLWEFAKAGGYVIVTKDDDFIDMQSVLGSPPKIIFLGLGNCTNQQVTEALIGSKAEIEAALSKEDTGFVEVI